jgi:hypothetical protein
MKREIYKMLQKEEGKEHSQKSKKAKQSKINKREGERKK